MHVGLSLDGRVGVAPGTITMVIPSGDTSQDAGVYNDWSPYKQGRLGDTPTEGELSRLYQYWPVHEGWLPSGRPQWGDPFGLYRIDPLNGLGLHNVEPLNGALFEGGKGSLLGIHWSVWATMTLAGLLGGALGGYVGGRRGRGGVGGGVGAALSALTALGALGAYEIHKSELGPGVTP